MIPKRERRWRKLQKDYLAECVGKRARHHTKRSDVKESRLIIMSMMAMIEV